VVDDPILRRICRQAGVPDLVEALSERIPPTDLRTLLLEVTRRSAERRHPADLRSRHAADRTVAPAAADGRALARVSLQALESAPDYQPIELSPVEPQGLNQVLGRIDQYNVLATVRSTEVVADPTSALTLEAAARRTGGQSAVRLCTCHRVLRLQPFDGPGLLQHFRLFAMVSAGRSEPGHGFALRALAEHVEAYLMLYGALHPGGRAVVRLSDTAVHQHLRERGIEPTADVAAPADAVPEAELGALGRRLHRLERAMDAVRPLAAHTPGVRVLTDLSRTHATGYYDGLQLRIDVEVDGEMRDVADGGSVDWMQRLLSDRREALFTSGIGLERMLPGYPPPP
jgi:hypothetical protein